MKRTRAAKESSSARSGTALAIDDSDQHAERREHADDQGVAQLQVAVGALTGGADERDDADDQQRGRLALDLAEAEEDGQRRHEQHAAADADQAARQAAGDREQRGEHLVHDRPPALT